MKKNQTTAPLQAAVQATLSLALLLAFLSCTKDDPGVADNVIDEDNSITAFTLNGVAGSIDQETRTIRVKLDEGTNITALSPEIVHDGERIEPASSQAQSFSSLVTYTVTAEDGSTAEYDVRVLVGDAFITTWNTQKIIVPTNPDLDYDYQVDWNNDGVFDESGIDGDAEKDFDTEGPHTIRIQGTFPAIRFSKFSDQERRNGIVSVDQWGTIAWESMSEAFFGCTQLEVTATDIPNLAGVDDMSDMFGDATMDNLDISQWDVSSVTDMSFMFYRTTIDNLDVSQWDVSSVTDMSFMFYGTTMDNLDVSQWDISGVTDMRRIFWTTTIANLNVSQWDVSHVTDMSLMFVGATIANLDVSGWDVSSVTDMSLMFAGATIANLDVSQWDVSSVTDMAGMFEGATMDNLDVSQWDVSSVTNMQFMFNNSGMSPQHYANALKRFAAIDTQNGIELGASGITFCDEPEVHQAKETLAGRGWTITDGGPIPCDE